MGVSTIIRAAWGLCACAALAACGDARDTPQTTDLPTFVSLNPCLDAILAEIAAPEQILALSHYSRDPSATSMATSVARQFAMTGGTAEEVIALQPDMVLASSFIAPATKAALERAGLTVETFGSPASVEESLEQIADLAALAGREEVGTRLADRIAATPQQLQGSAGSALLWQPGQIVAGEASLVAQHLRWAGFENEAASRGLGQADYVSLETVIADPPQLLLIAGDSAGQEHPLLAAAPGSMHVARFEPRLFYCGGPSIPAARQRLLDIREEMRATQ